MLLIGVQYRALTRYIHFSIFYNYSIEDNTLDVGENQLSSSEEVLWVVLLLLIMEGKLVLKEHEVFGRQSVNN